MQVGVLGPLIVRVDDHDVTPRGQRLRDVFVALLQRRGRSVPANVILDLVWADDAAGRNVSVVHTVVARLRHRLGPTAISSDDVGYLLERGVTTDEDAFTELLAMARRQRGADEPGLACDSYRRALAGWRGLDAFEGVKAELVEADRARLSELRTAAVEELAEVLLDHPGTGGPAEALELTGNLISGRPLRERPYYLAMLAAYRCHRQAEALAIYQRLHRLLRAELGIEPTPATVALHSMVLRQDAQLDGHRAPRAAARPTPVRATCLPAPVTPLIGRATELATVGTALATGHRLVTLIGPGGVGKSRLLIELGARRDDTKGLVYAEMSGLGVVGPDELAEAIAVGHGVLDSRRPPLDSLVTALADGNWLLLIDEAEWVVDSLAPVVTAVLDGCPGVQIVLTSRIPLEVSGESLVRIEPLAVPGGDAEPGSILTSPAVEFLVQRLADRAVAVADDRSTANLLASIARRVDGLPLALELAAGQACGRSLRDIAVLVESPLDVPAAQRSRNARHRSLRDTLEWSMNRLPTRHRTVLCRLAVYVGRFDLADAAAVAGMVDVETVDTDTVDTDTVDTDTVDTEVGEIVRSLAREALIHVERSSAFQLNFRLLRTLRDLALEGLDPAELAATQALHRRWHAGLWRGAAHVDLVQDVRDRLDDYVEALRSALESRDSSTLADLTLTLTEYWRYSGGQVVGLKWTGRVLDSGILGVNDRARVQGHRAALALHHFPDVVLADTEAAIPVLEARGDHPLLVLSHMVRAVELAARGRGGQARDQANSAVRVARIIGGEPLAKALSVQANVEAVFGNATLADDAITEVGSLVDRSTPPATRITAFTNVGLAMLNLDRPQDALRLLALVGPEVARVTGRTPPDFYLLCKGWAELGCGATVAALNSFSASVPTQSPGIADRQSAETYLGVGCALAELGLPDAASMLAAAQELTDRVQLTIPPAMGRIVTRAMLRIGMTVSTDLSGEPTPALLDEINRMLRDACRQLLGQVDPVDQAHPANQPDQAWLPVAGAVVR